MHRTTSDAEVTVVARTWAMDGRGRISAPLVFRDCDSGTASSS